MKAIRTMEPLRDKKDIEAMKNLMPTIRDKVMFSLGINTGLRISDLVTLRCADFKTDTIEIREKKTGKIKAFKLNPAIASMVQDYINLYPREWLLPSRRHGCHLSERQALDIIKAAAEKLGLEHIGTHTLRKTFGYQAWKKGISLAYIMEAMNHSSIKITKRYLGITQDELNDELYTEMSL